MLFATLQLLTLWLVAGITFWSGFVLFGFRFAEAHARGGVAPRGIPDGAPMPATVGVDTR